ncbi:MAG: hypothetical protein L6407_01245 [Candidatus Delongbacteria bacterium]|nr:hypothetical protein [Candidatus Delongbacteria bacterium]
MKIAVVTTHYANNYGALLQTFALQKYLNNELGQDAVALAYFPPGYKISWGVFHKPRSVKEFLRFVFFLLNMKKVRAVKIRAKKK